MNPVKTVQDLERKKQELTDQFNEIVKKNTCPCGVGIFDLEHSQECSPSTCIEPQKTDYLKLLLIQEGLMDIDRSITTALGYI